MSEHEYDTDNQMAGDSLIAVLDELRQIVETARGVPMSASAMINRSEVLDLLDTARDIVPDQIEAADRIIAEASEVKTDAQRRAKTILERAHEDAERAVSEGRRKAADLVAEHAITAEAEARAAKIIEDAKTSAGKLRAGADRYSDDSLAHLQNELDSLLAKVHAGRQELSRRQSQPASVDNGIDEGHAPRSEQLAEPPVDANEQDSVQEPQRPAIREIRVSPIDEEEFEEPFEPGR